MRQGMERGESKVLGGGSFRTCPSYLTIDQESLARWSSVPTPKRDTSNISPLSTFSQHSLFFSILLNYVPFFTVCGHHLSPGVAIVFQLRCILEGGGGVYSIRAWP